MQLLAAPCACRRHGAGEGVRHPLRSRPPPWWLGMSHWVAMTGYGFESGRVASCARRTEPNAAPRSTSLSTSARTTSRTPGRWCSRSRSRSRRARRRASRPRARRRWCPPRSSERLRREGTGPERTRAIGGEAMWLKGRSPLWLVSWNSLLPRQRAPMGCARIEKRSHGAKRPELRAFRQRAECGSEPFVDVLIQLLMQRACSHTCSFIPPFGIDEIRSQDSAGVVEAVAKQ